MLILPRYVAGPLTSTEPAWLRAGSWVDHSAHEAVTDAQSTSILMIDYLWSYRQRENVALKTKFWTIYFKFLSAMEEIYQVPIQKNTRREQPASTMEQLTFLNLRLNEEQMTACDDAKVSPAQLMTSLAAVIEGGLAFSLNYNAEREVANATFMDKRQGSSSKGYALSAFGENIPDALKILLFKHLNVLGGDWADLIGKPQAMNRRG